MAGEESALIGRLRILEGKLEDSGSYVSANTVWLAITRIKELEQAERDRNVMLDARLLRIHELELDLAMARGEV